MWNLKKNIPKVHDRNEMSAETEREREENKKNSTKHNNGIENGKGGKNEDDTEGVENSKT